MLFCWGAQPSGTTWCRRVQGSALVGAGQALLGGAVEFFAASFEAQPSAAKKLDGGRSPATPECSERATAPSFQRQREARTSAQDDFDVAGRRRDNGGSCPMYFQGFVG